MSVLRSTIRKVACGISGGVDSAVAAFLLKQKGFEVVGVFMRNWDGQDERGTCQSTVDDLNDAQAVCDALNIELQQISFVKEYWNDVFSSVLEDYEKGLTPNPDIFCNRFIKFGAFYKHAIERLGVDAIATGHYARSSFGNFLENYRPNQNVNLLRGLDPGKDQTLFLSQVHQQALRKSMFPLGNYYKKQVRQIAHENNLAVVASKPDSTGICFIGNRKFTDFIAEYIPDKRGPFVCIDTNKVIDYHNGVHHYTIGQRCRIQGQPVKYFAVSRDPRTQTIVVAADRNHPSLYGNYILTHEPHWIADAPDLPYYCMFRFQHSDRCIPCHVTAYGRGLRVLLAAPLRALTPGQIGVFYKNQICLGSGKIITAGWQDNEELIEEAALEHASSAVR